VTGTKGKSTTVKLISEMLQAAGLNAIRSGNTGIPLIAELPNLSPESWAIVEVSSFSWKSTVLQTNVAVLLKPFARPSGLSHLAGAILGTKLKLFAIKRRRHRNFQRGRCACSELVSGKLGLGTCSANNDVRFWTSSSQHDTNACGGAAIPSA
jgi:hypothetical protein